MLISAIIISFFGVPTKQQSSSTTLGEGVIPLVVLTILFGFFINMIYTPAYAEVSSACSSCVFVPPSGTEDDDDSGSDLDENADEEQEDGSGRSYGLISTVVCLGEFNVMFCPSNNR